VIDRTTRPGRLRHRSWRELTDRQRRFVVVAGAVELVLTAVAAADLARRDASALRGPKAVWAALLSVQPVGPVAYLLLGRRGSCRP
jgi:hypothetical protein